MIKNFFLSLFVMAGLAVSANAQSSQIYLSTSKSIGTSQSSPAWTDVMSTTISTAGTYVIAVTATFQVPSNDNVTGFMVQNQLVKNGTYISLSFAQQDYPGALIYNWVRLTSFAVVTLAVNDVVKLQERGYVEGSGSGSFYAAGQDDFDGATVITLLQL